MVEWGALSETRQPGCVSVADGHRLRFHTGGGRHDEWAGGWLLEAALTRQRPRVDAPRSHSCGTPCCSRSRDFATARDAMARKRLELFREGAGEEVVGLRYRPAGEK